MCISPLRCDHRLPLSSLPSDRRSCQFFLSKHAARSSWQWRRNQVMHSLESWRRHIAIYRCTSNPMEAKIYCPGFRFWQFIYFILRFIPHQISMLQIWAVLSQSKTLSFQHLLLSLGLQNPDHFILDVSKNSIELRFATCWVRHSWSRLCYFKIRVASIGGWCLTNLNCRIGSPTK